MFPWAALVGLAGQAVSGILSANANRKAQQRTDEANRRVMDWVLYGKK